MYKRIGLGASDRGCSRREEGIESARHLFLECKDVEHLWNQLVAWIGTSWAAPRAIDNHLLLFSRLVGGKKWRRRLGSLWVCTIWVIWKWRNDVLFSNKEWNFRRIGDEIKCRFWSWCAARGEVESIMSFNNWANHSLYSQWNRN